MQNPLSRRPTLQTAGRIYRPEIAPNSLPRQRLLQTVTEVDTVNFTNSAVATL
jgi:hypothetical protein